MSTFFYDNKQDPQLVNDFLLEQPDIFIQKWEFTGTGVYAEASSTSATLTPATSPSWTVDAFNSTVALNLYVVDDNGKLSEGKVFDNDATSITFDPSAMSLLEDGSTAPTFTASGTYSFYILSPSSITGATYGDFFGYTNELTFTPNQETVQFDYDIPKTRVREDLISNLPELSGSYFSWGQKIVKSGLGLSQYGSQSSQISYGFGTTTFNNDFYRVTLDADLVDDRNQKIIIHKTKIMLSGETSFSEEGYKMVPITMKLFANTLLENEGANYYIWQIADS